MSEAAKIAAIVVAALAIGSVLFLAIVALLARHEISEDEL